MADDGWRQVAEDDWTTPPNHAWSIEFPGVIKALKPVGDTLFAILDDGRTVDLSGLFSDRAN